MLIEQFSKSKYLIIVFPGGCGGNHIQNMISLIPNFNKVFESPNYYTDLYQNYNKIKSQIVPDSVGIQAHFSQFSNLSGLQNIEFVTSIQNSSKKTILIGHDHCIQESIEANNFLCFEDCVWIIVTWPQTPECVVYKRIMQRKHWPQQTHRYSFPYLVPTTLNFVDCDRGFALDPIKIFSINGSHYLRKKLYDHFNLELPPEADELHKLWYAGQEYFMTK